MALCGGHSDVAPATQEIQDVINKVKAQVEQKLSKSFIDLAATSFRRQVVAGLIYFIRVLASEKDGDEAPPKLSVLHLRVFQPLFDEPVKLQALRTAKPSDSLEIMDTDPSLL